MTARDRKVLHVGIVVLLLITISRALPAIRQWSAESQRNALLVRRELEALRQHGTTLRTLESLRAAVRSRGHWLLSGPADMADASLAQALKDAADEAAADLVSVQPMRTEAARFGMRLVRARVAVTGEFAALIYFMATIESGPPKAVLREMVLSQLDVSIAATRPETVRGELVVEVLALSDTAAGAAR